MGSPGNPGAAMWDERFSRAELVYGEEPNAYLRVQSAQLKPGMKVFVPGDGYGRNGIWLAKQGFEVRTVDISPVGVARARKAAREVAVPITIELADLSAWDWPESEFDAVMSIFLHLSPEVRPIIHAEMLRALKTAGVVILEAFTPTQIGRTSGGPKRVELLYTAEMLRKDFNGAQVVELEERDVNLDEGALHHGIAAVVRGLFRKR
jgi:cyclopropane fatty-acyl-phospholipid synthase-like methyltransferase